MDAREQARRLQAVVDGRRVAEMEEAERAREAAEKAAEARREQTGGSE